MRRIYTNEAPTPGAYSQGVLVGDTLYLSGQTGNDVNLKDEAVVEGGVGPQTYQSLKNLLAIVEAAGGNVSSFVKLNVYLKNPGSEEKQQADRDAFNQAYTTFFATRGIGGIDGQELPARAQVWVANIPLPSEPTLVEIDGVAAIPTSNYENRDEAEERRERGSIW